MNPFTQGSSVLMTCCSPIQRCHGFQLYRMTADDPYFHDNFSDQHLEEVVLQN